MGLLWNCVGRTLLFCGCTFFLLKIWSHREKRCREEYFRERMSYTNISRLLDEIKPDTEKKRDKKFRKKIF